MLAEFRGFPSLRRARIVTAAAGRHRRPGAWQAAALSVVLALACALAPAGPALAQQEAAPASADPALEARMQALTHTLRCLVCQNQSIAESDAPLAQDLRAQVREQLAAGKSDREVVDYLVARYGDFVLYRPPFKPLTALLWGGPAALLLAGAFWLGWRLRRRARETPAELSAAEHAQAQALLDGPAEHRPEDLS